MYVFKGKGPGIRVARKRLLPFTLQTSWSRVSDPLWLLQRNTCSNSNINTCRKYFSHIIHLNNIVFCTECIRVLSILTVLFNCQYKYRLSAYSYRQVSLEVLFHVSTHSNILLGRFCMKCILTKGMCSPFNSPSFCLFWQCIIANWKKDKDYFPDYMMRDVRLQQRCCRKYMSAVKLRHIVW
jgi:hypothetical protein